MLIAAFECKKIRCDGSGYVADEAAVVFNVEVTGDIQRMRCSTGHSVRPNVRAKLPAEACSVSLVCEGAEGAAHQAYAACSSGSA